MKVAIVYLIKGEAQHYQKKLIKKVADLSGEKYVAYDTLLPQHITLKVPFNIKNIKKLEILLSEFTAEQKRHPLKIRKFGNFRKFVTFLTAEFPIGARKIQKQLVKTVNEEYRLKPHNHELEWKPHATIAYGNNKDTFKIIWKYLNSLEKPSFDLEFDNITILKKSRKLWKIHKVFKIPN